MNGWWWFYPCLCKGRNKEHLRSVMKEYKELNFGFDYEGTSIV